MEATMTRPLRFDPEAAETYFGDYLEDASAIVREVHSGMKVDEVRELVWRAMHHGFAHAYEACCEAASAALAPDNPYLLPEPKAAR
jgi:hypothetical protein